MRRSGSALTARMCVVVSAAMSVSACNWFTDFKRQPKMDPWETASDTIGMRGNPQMSVSIYGTAAPGFAYGRAPTHGAVDSMAAIVNPVASDERSLREGHKLYAINCLVCHGDRGMADGPVVQFGLPVLPIGAGTKAATQFSDGYIFGIIRNGRGLMPTYNRIEERERWDLINYLRTVQSGAAGVQIGAVGRPGETGDKLPSASPTAPTRPAPFYKPSISVAPATSTPSPAAAPSTTRPPTP
jgi:mono/diheme cytochrome c family protein